MFSNFFEKNKFTFILYIYEKNYIFVNILFLFLLIIIFIFIFIFIFILLINFYLSWTPLRRLLHTVSLLPMPPPNYRSRSSLSGASTPKILWIARYHHRHMDMSTVPHSANPVTLLPSTVSAAPAAPVVDTFAPQFHACGSTAHHLSRIKPT